MKKVIIADNQLLIREGVKNLINSHPEIQLVSEVSESAELRQRLKEVKPDILIIDCNQNEYFSIQDIDYVKTTLPSCVGLVLSESCLREEVQAAIQAGITNYVLKKCSKEDLWQALNSAIKNQKYFCSTVLDALLPKTSESQPAKIILTDREIEIVKLIVKGYSNNTISKLLFLSIHTVSTHRKNIFKKLGLKNSLELMLYCIDSGIMTPEAIKDKC